MNAARSFTHYISVALLLLWGAVLLYFYASGRIMHYLPPDGIFRPMVLVAGVGLGVLALFNLFTTRAAEHDCCHDHGHDHDHDHGHDHHDCCGHDHGHEHHSHSHGAHDHNHECCGHDHHQHHHHHAHDHPAEPVEVAHAHAHGMLEESGLAGRITAIAILALPITLAALNTPDQFSPRVAENKGLYNPNYADTSRAAEFSLKKAAKPELQGSPSAVQPAVAVAPPDTPPAPAVAAAPSAADTPPSTTPAGSDAPPAMEAEGAEAKSYGSFTLADLEAQVPKSSAGNFILDVPEIYYTGGDIEVQKVLTGQPVETIAQVLPEKVNNDEGHRLRIFRMLVQCCAADARPYSIPVDFGKKAPEFAEMSWVKVTGTMTYKQEGGQTVPVLEVKSIEETTAPDQAMIY